MPALLRKLLVIAAVDGLVLQPVHQRNQRGLKLEYSSGSVSACDALKRNENASLECHGIIGLLTVPPAQYLVAVSGRKQVAQIRGAPIYVITDVSFISTASQAEAKRTIDQAIGNLHRRTRSDAETSGSDSEVSDKEDGEAAERNLDDNDNVSVEENVTHDDQPEDPTRPPNPGTRTSSVAEDVMSKKGQYGRFAEKWFSRKGWTADRRKTQGMSTDSVSNQAAGAVKNTVSGAAATAQALSQSAGNAVSSLTTVGSTHDTAMPSIVTSTLLPKLLRTSHMLLTSGGFFFSYDIDITRRLSTYRNSASDVPLHRSVDPLFFWNRHLSKSFIDGGHEPFILPVMQGFVGQKSFAFDKHTKELKPAGSDPEGNDSKLSDSKPASEGSDKPRFLVTLISRRSTKRPGLRYLRRGVDDEGNTANSIETEQILSDEKWLGKVFSFVQIRGSIPVFFSQSPYSFKPVPVLQHSQSRNQAAFDRHFKDVASRYGGVQIVLLVDKHGGEAAIGQQYEQSYNELNANVSEGAKKLGFEWFDFHNICRGMKFENVSLLMDSLSATLQEFGQTTENEGVIQTQQSGVFRTSCMDCLDRTNVVQSAFGQRALEKQLQEEGIDLDLRKDASTNWFNELWADNGDAISKQYSSTAALKGDYTRTRKRDYRGAINDLGLTLSRYYNNIVNDFFSQAAIDYLLGNVTVRVFQDFEDNLMSGDPGMSMQKVRENAINTCTKIVIVDGDEDLVGGWTMLSPCRSNTLVAFPLEEVILLLTDAALYAVRYNWNNDKVISFERVDLRNVIGIIKGAYITSSFTSAQMDEERNVGFVVRYRPGKEDVARVNTRSLNTGAIGSEGTDELDVSVGKESKDREGKPVKMLPFKALPARSSFVTEGQDDHFMSEKETVNSVCEEIQRAVHGDVKVNRPLIEEKPIISLQEARKNTGYVDQLGHVLKRLVWA